MKSQSLALTLSLILHAFGAAADPAPLPPPPKPPAVKLTADPPKPLPCQPCIVDCDARGPVLWRVQGAPPSAYKVRANSLFLTIPEGAPGVTVLAYTVVGDAVAETVLVLTPDPPKPPPMPPQPADPLIAKLQAAFTADAGPDKAADLKQLAVLWDEAAQFARNRTDLTTAGQLLGAVREASASLVPTGRLSGVRQVIGEELAAVLPTDPDAALDGALRAKCATAFKRIGAALAGVK